MTHARREVDERDALGLGDEGGALERWEPLAAPRGRALELHEPHDAKLLHDRLGCRGRGGTGLVVAVPHVIT